MVPGRWLRPEDSGDMGDRRQWWGWVLFLVSAIIFVAVGIRDRDMLLVTGSAAFLAACVLFLWAFPRR